MRQLTVVCVVSVCSEGVMRVRGVGGAVNRGDAPVQILPSTCASVWMGSFLGLVCFKWAQQEEGRNSPWLAFIGVNLASWFLASVIRPSQFWQVCFRYLLVG